MSPCAAGRLPLRVQQARGQGDGPQGGGVTTPRSVTLPKETCHDLGARAVLDRIVTTLGLPLFVKPTRAVRPLGPTLVSAVEDLPSAMIGCFAHDDTVCRELLRHAAARGT